MTLPPVTARQWQWVLWVLLVTGLIRLWLMPLPSSFWIDEMGTAFVVHHGGSHPSFAIAPQVPASLYYALPRAAEAWFGFSEISYRLPSVLVFSIAFTFLLLLARRLVAPQAVWFMAFACLSLRGFNYQADDARPYALGMCVAAISVWSLLRWLDNNSWLDALCFAVGTALLWRVHLIFWPFYAVYALYAAVRLWRRDTPVSLVKVLAVFSLIGVSLVPVLQQALTLNRDAKSHVIARLPNLTDLMYTWKAGFVLACGLGAYALARWRRWSYPVLAINWSSVSLIAGWWLLHPLLLALYSWTTGNSVFVARYLGLALPGAALAATWAVARYLRPECWMPVSAGFGLGVLLIMGQWNKLWPAHHPSGWREAAQSIQRLGLRPETPVLCPSPFIEAQPPVWQPDYPLPGFLYAHLDVYRIPGKPVLLPFEIQREGKLYARQLASSTLPAAGRFLIYGGDRFVWRWRDILEEQPTLRDWTNRQLGPFGDIDVVLFEAPAAPISKEKPH